tara:strand:- start:291 stop:500 length:210 start_codon:yes stop_codon:yes gene_type:complete
MKFYETKEKFFEDIGVEWETFNIEDFTCSFYALEKAKYMMRDDQGIDYLVSEKYAKDNNLLKGKKKKND